MRVVDPNGTVHSYVLVGEERSPVSSCGQPCGTWTCMVGGDPDCPRCQEANLRKALDL